MKIGELNANVAVIGGVAGFGLYLLWKWTRDDTPGGGFVTSAGAVIGGAQAKTAGAVSGAIQKHNAAAAEVGKNLPFSPWWWYDKVTGAYNAIN